jgi:hypothetical protein
MKKPIEYGEYKEILDIVQRTNVEDSYQDLMGKETKVLDTVNKVVKFHRDEDIKSGEFIYQDMTTTFTRFFDVWKEIIDDYTVVGNKNKSMIEIFTSGDRPIYVGISLMIVGLILFFVESSKW